MRRPAWWLPLLVAMLGLRARPARAGDDLLQQCEAYAAAHVALPLATWSGRFRDPDLKTLLAEIGMGDVGRVLASQDPKVRTLGAAALGAADSPARLQLLADLVDDERPSFAFTHVANVAFVQREDGSFGPSGPPTYTEPWTVARWANFWIRQWMHLDLPHGAAWRDWWSGVKDAETLVSVWNCRIRRAQDEDRERQPRGGEGTPALDATLARLRKEHGGALFTLVAPTYEDSSPGPFAKTDLDALVRGQFTTDFALRCLRREPPFADPWVRPGESAYGTLCRRLLLALPFAPADAATILGLEQAERAREPSLASEAWPIAASRALPDPARKRAVLVAAYSRYSKTWEQHLRFRIACELWRTLGPDAIGIVLGWYFDEREPRINSGGFQEAVAQCVAESGAAGRRFVAAVLADERSRDLPWASIASLARACNQLAGEPIVPEREMQDLHHPIGAYHLSREAGLEEGRQKHPEATARVLKTIASWRDRLRAYAASHGW